MKELKNFSQNVILIIDDIQALYALWPSQSHNFVGNTYIISFKLEFRQVLFLAQSLIH